MKNNAEIIQMISENKKLKPSTTRLDTYSLNLYSTIEGLSLMELIQEADDDEENIRKVRRRRINNHLDHFINCLENDTHKHKRGMGYTPRSIHDILSRVRAFYNYYEIQLPRTYLPQIPSNEKSTDIPTLKEIRYVIDNTGKSKHRAIILFMLSSGLSSNEVSSLTKKQFMEATSEYQNSQRLPDALDELKTLIDNGEAIIPTWELTRGKTNYNFITFNSPEATMEIVEFLTTKAHPTDKRLFEMGNVGINDLYLKLGKRNNIGYTNNGHNKFHSHAMRKVFATTLAGVEIKGVPLDSLFVEFLLGHKLPGSMEPYYKNRPKRLKKIYIEVVDSLSVNDLNKLTIKSPEYLKLEKENNDMKTNIEAIVEEAMLKHDQELRKQQDRMSIDDLFHDF